jgi:PKD repeat protein
MPQTGTGLFSVSGGHTYADEGTYQVSVHVVDDGGSQATVGVSVRIADAALVASAATFTGTEGQAVSPTVATFTDANPLATTADFSTGGGSTTIDWGDGTSSAGTVTQTGTGRFSVSGGHTYADEGSYQVSVHVVDDGGSQATVGVSVRIADAGLTATGTTIVGLVNEPLSPTVATFTDANPLATTADFSTGGGSTTIDWGDGTSSTGTVTQTGTGQFSVSGGHTYAGLGHHVVTVTIVDDGGSVTSATSDVIVFAYPKGGAFVIGDGNSQTGTSVSFWSALWAKLNTLDGGTAPSAFKGFENASAPPSVGVGWTTKPGDSPPPPAGPLPAYMGVIVSSRITRSGLTISGDTQHIVVVRVDPGYRSDPGHDGTGTVIATYR